MRILIISYFFPPYNTIGAVRLGKLAKYWHENGHDIRVLTAKDQLEPQTLDLEVPIEQVMYTHWINLNFWVRLLSKDRGESLSLTTTDEREGLLSKAASLYRATFNFPDGKIGWYPAALSQAEHLLDKWEPDFIYASAHPPTVLLIAERLAKRHKIPWFAELRDLWTKNHYYAYAFPRRNIETWLEKRTLTQATGLVTVSEPLRSELKAFGIPTQTILNGYDLQNCSGQQPQFCSKLRIIYTGIIYVGKRDPSPLFQALQNLGDRAKDIEVKFFGRRLGVVAELAKRYGVEASVQVQDAVSYQESLRLQKAADVLLLLTWNHPSEKGVYTGKLFEYVGALRPILNLGAQDSVAADLIRERGLGATLAEPDEIAQWLSSKLEQKNQTGIPDWPQSARAGLSRVEQFEKLDSFIAAQLEGRA